MFRSLILVFSLLVVPAGHAMDFSNWQSGAVGYFKAERFARTKHKPMVVYFHTDWCPNCARLNSHFLSNAKVQRFFDDFSRVQINPEKGPKDHAIYEEYNVQAVPGFYVVLPGFDRKKRVHPLETPKDWPISRFISEISKFTAQAYREEGLLTLNRGEHRQAVKFLEASLKYDDQNPETYRLIGECYAGMGSAYAQRARQYFQKAEKLGG